MDRFGRHARFMLNGAMPYVPEDIELAWKELKLTLLPEMTSFARYYETTWIGTVSSPPLFDHASWNHHDSSLMLLPCSSNIAEVWNNGFASLVSCRNPTIWSFLECARKEQAITDMKIANILTRRPFRREHKWVQFDLELERIVADYKSYGTILEFLRAVDPESSAKFFCIRILYITYNIHNIDLKFHSLM